MGVNHRKDKKDKPARQQNNEDGFIPPDFADKLGHVGFHATGNYTTSYANVNDLPDEMMPANAVRSGRKR